MQFASLKAKLGGGLGVFGLLPSSFLSPSLSGRSADMTEILLTGSLNLNSINQPLISSSFLFYLLFVRKYMVTLYIFNELCIILT